MFYVFYVFRNWKIFLLLQLFLGLDERLLFQLYGLNNLTSFLKNSHFSGCSFKFAFRNRLINFSNFIACSVRELEYNTMSSKYNIWKFRFLASRLVLNPLIVEMLPVHSLNRRASCQTHSAHVVSKRQFYDYHLDACVFDENLKPGQIQKNILLRLIGQGSWLYLEVDMRRLLSYRLAYGNLTPFSIVYVRSRLPS